jgi:hypothetical protein
MSVLVALALIVLIIVGSYVIHEYAHAFIAKAFGWKLCGWRWFWYAVGYKIEAVNGPRGIRYIAAAGLTATAILALIGRAWAGPFGLTLFWMNVAILFCGLIPVPGNDIWFIIRGNAALKAV